VPAAALRHGMGAGTFIPPRPARARPELGAPPRAASGGPRTGATDRAPTACKHYYQYQVVLKPRPDESAGFYLGSPQTLGMICARTTFDFRSDWRVPTLGAGVSAGVVAERDGGHPSFFSPTSSRWPASTANTVLGELPTARTPRHVPARARKASRSHVGGRRHLRRRLPPNEVEQSKYNFEASDGHWLLSAIQWLTNHRRSD